MKPMRMFEMLCCFGLAVNSCLMAAEPAPLYHADFEKVEVGKLPDNLLVLDGAFTVQDQGTNKVLELPGAPLDSFGLLFGPTEKDGVVVSARVYGTHKGRRFPVFAVGLNGVGGYKLQVDPAKKALELLRGEAGNATVKASVPFTWESGKWTHLLIRLLPAANGHKIEGKAWVDGPKPTAWSISAEDKDELPPGRPGLFASPFAGTPILFDDLSVAKTD